MVKILICIQLASEYLTPIVMQMSRLFVKLDPNYRLTALLASLTNLKKLQNNIKMSILPVTLCLFGLILYNRGVGMIFKMVGPEL